MLHLFSAINMGWRRKIESKIRQEPQQPKVQGPEKQLQSVREARPREPLRRSARLEKIYHLEKQIIEKDGSDTQKHQSSKKESSQNLSVVLQPNYRTQKRPREAGDPPFLPAQRPQKRPRTSLAGPTVSKPPVEDTPGQEAADNEDNIDLVDYWRKEGSWPREYFERSNMSHLRARKKSTPSLRRKQSQSTLTSSTTPSDQKPREEKSAQYKNPRYTSLLESKGSFMSKANVGVTDASKHLCSALLETEQTTPKESLFQDDLFDKVCEKIQDRNETRVIRDIALLIVPSAETLSTYGSTNLECLIESTNEGWDNTIPITKPRPQPDYSVGFRRGAFADEQLQKLQPFVGDLIDTSYFMATYYMYFPFLACEVKCGAAALDIADRQNAHSATIAVRATVELFKLVKREKEVDREILAFSISHDHRTVRIYGHYPVINSTDTQFYRHPIRTFDFTEQDGKEKWTAYKFTRNIYDIWMPNHFKRICSAIDQIPADVGFDVSQSELQSSNPGSVRALEDDSHSSASASLTPTTSFTEPRQVFKKSRKNQ